jgi:hypothetical protein
MREAIESWQANTPRHKITPEQAREAHAFKPHPTLAQAIEAFVRQVQQERKRNT